MNLGAGRFKIKQFEFQLKWRVQTYQMDGKRKGNSQMSLHKIVFSPNLIDQLLNSLMVALKVTKILA